jgi:kynurenine formamidase
VIAGPESPGGGAGGGAGSAAGRGGQPGRGWGWIWGDQDEVGALNSAGPRSVLAAMQLVHHGRVIDLGVTVSRQSYCSPAHPRTEVLRFRTPESLLRETAPDPAGGEAVSFNTSMIIISDHAGTQIDGLAHAVTGADYHWYNGFSWAADSGDFGVARAGAQNIPPIIAPGVVLDIPAALGVPQLTSGQAIGPDDLDAALRRQRTFIAPGDVVLIRTGMMRDWGEAGADHAALAKSDLAGLSLAGARWLVEEKGALMIAADNSAVEVHPPVDGDCLAPVHKYLLVEQGVHMGELHNLEELVRAGESRFCYVALAPKVAGTTAGFAMRPVAVI